MSNVKPSDAGAWLKTHPRLRVKLATLGIDAYVLLNKIWLYCQDAGNTGRLPVDEVAAACDRLLPAGRISKALAELERPVMTHKDGSTSPLWLLVDAGTIVMPAWWLDDNPGPEVWNDDTARSRLARNKRLLRMPELCEKIKHRDRNLCRYCGRRVKWGANNSDIGGTYDHIDPDEDNTLSNVVVACRRDNGRKNDRTPDQWIEEDPVQGLSLLPAGTTADQAPGVHAARAGPNPGSTGVRPRSDRSSRSHASPDRVEPGSNRDRTAPVLDLSRPGQGTAASTGMNDGSGDVG